MEAYGPDRFPLDERTISLMHVRPARLVRRRSMMGCFTLLRIVWMIPGKGHLNAYSFRHLPEKALGSDPDVFLRNRHVVPLARLTTARDDGDQESKRDRIRLTRRTRWRRRAFFSLQKQDLLLTYVAKINSVTLNQHFYRANFNGTLWKKKITLRLKQACHDSEHHQQVQTQPQPQRSPRESDRTTGLLLKAW